MASTQTATAPAALGTPTQTLRVERRFRAAPERVFRAWTSPEELNRWSDPDPSPAATEVDLRVGGRYAIAMARAGGVVHRVSGVYREIDPPKKLVYTWRWETAPDFPDTLVTVEFRARPDGGTDLVLVHEGLPNEDSLKRHEHGWCGSLDKLVALAD